MDIGSNVKARLQDKFFTKENTKKKTANEQKATIT